MAVEASSSSSPCASTFTYDYDAYLNFRGEDTRYGFTRNLYFALKDRGVNAYLDEINLEIGDEIGRSLFTAIENSRTAIIVLSENYASSAFCLKELVKILDCVKGQGRLIIPVFYNVDPSDVRNQRGYYEKVFASHEERFRIEDYDKVEKWRMALKQVADLVGYHFKQGHGYEHEFIAKIAEQVSTDTGRAALPAVDHPIGLDSKLQSVTALRDFGSNDARMVGNHGIGEIGQSTSKTLRIIANHTHHIVDSTIVDSPCASAFTYDVFLNFRGETRFGFTGNLYSALKKKGIKAFIDDVELGKGKEITSSLFTAIERSRTAIVVLSQHYASSSHCLDELVKIMECVEGRGRLVIPVFYGMNPAWVRLQKGSYLEAFAKHEHKQDMEKLQKWRMALCQVANLHGFVITNGYLYEHDFIVKIVERVSRETTRAALPVVDHPVDLDSQVQNETSLLNSGSNYVCMVGNHGVGGIGQSTTMSRTTADGLHHAANNTNANNVRIANNSTTMQPQAIAPSTTTITYVMPFPDISKIERFEGQNFKRWQERVLSLLDMHGVVDALTNPKPESFAGQEKLDDWIYANKICRYTICSTLSNELFDIYCSYKEANKIWESMILEYTAEDAGRQRIVIRNYYNWEMTDDKDIQVQINEYHKLLEDLKAENITLQDEFVARLLIEKLPDSWKDYKQQLQDENKQLSLADLIAHITIEDTNRKVIKEARAKTLIPRANLLQTQGKSYNGTKSNFNYNKPNTIPRAPNPTFTRTGGCFICESPGHRAAQCYKRASRNSTTAESSQAPSFAERQNIQASFPTSSSGIVIGEESHKKTCCIVLPTTTDESFKNQIDISQDDDVEMEGFYASLDGETHVLSPSQDHLPTNAPNEEAREALKIVQDFITNNDASVFLDREWCNTMKSSLDYLYNLSSNDGLSGEIRALISEALGVFIHCSSDYIEATMKIESSALEMLKADKLKANLKDNKNRFGEVMALEKELLQKLAEKSQELILNMT